MQPIQFTVQRIDGDYAHLADENGNLTPVARALLPEEIDEGIRLLFENFEYTVLR